MAKNVLYLLGAGATHAEIMNSVDNSDETIQEKYGLLINNVSRRVMKKAHEKIAWFKDNSSIFTSTKGSFNIELLISLLEANKIAEIIETKTVIQTLKSLVEEDIKKILSPTKRKTFYLHKALFELHKKIEEQETLLGIISLNYDGITDEAYATIHPNSANYYLEYEKIDEGLPLLKLHGSFDWEQIFIYGKQRNIPIMPIGMNKNYLFPPYNFIWGKAYELLTQCDILRVIGCSLNQNDLGLVDLLLKAHLIRSKAVEIEIIDFERAGEQIKDNYGFFAGIKLPSEIEDGLIGIEPIIKGTGTGNPFKIWLSAKSRRMLTNNVVNKTRYLSKCM